MKKKSLIASLALVLGAGLSCDQNPMEPATTGSISIVLLSPSGASFASIVDGRGSDLEPVDAVASIALTSARVTVTGTTGAGAAFSKTSTSATPTGSNFNLTVDGIPPGSYTVRVEGLANGAVAHFGETSGVNVSAGANTPASVSFPVFQPQLPAAASEDTSDVLRFSVAWNAVQNAQGYIVEWSQSANMAGAESKPVVGATTTEVAVTAEGKYFFTVKAVNAAVLGGGLASAPASVYVFQGVATVTVTPATPTIAAGATQQMGAEARDADNGVVNGVTWFWASSNHTVATVNQSGLVTGVGAGTATITAVGKGMPGSTNLTVTPAPLGPATKLAFVTQPAGAVANQTMSAVQVAVQTASGQTVTSDNATQVVLTIGTNAGGGTLGGTLTATVANGVATFSDLSINKAGNGYTLAAASNALTGATSSTFNINSGAAAKLAFSIQPTSSIAGDPLSPAVQVEIRDANDNLVTSARDPITIAFSANPGSGTLTGTKTVNAINGIASFTGIWVNKAAPDYTLMATSGSLAATTSSPFTVSPGAPFKLAFSQQPTNSQGSAVVTPAVTVTIADQYDNATTATTAVTVSLGDNPWKSPFSPGGSVAGTLTRAAVAGIATFNNLRVDKPAPGYSLIATATSLAGASSAGFNVNLTVKQVSTGVNSSHGCAITTTANGATDLATYCWGYNGNGQLGVPNSSFQDSIPVQVRTLQTFASVTVGASHSCGLTAAGAAFCWGYNGYGQLGNNTQTDSDVPVAVLGGHVFAQIEAGYLHTCGVTTSNGLNNAEDRQVYCWGNNDLGQIGDNTTGTARLTPVWVLEGAGLRTAEATQVVTGIYHTCARAANGNAFCWGYNAFGQLGDATVLNASGSGGINQPAPRLVAGGIVFQSLGAGAYTTCGISSVPGTPAFCWGRNNSGQIGNQTTTGASTPQSVFGGFAWGSISGGTNHTCGVITTGAGYCWGSNGNGELGDDNQPTASSQPVQVAGTLTFDRIDAGAGFSCGRTTNSGAYCWGTNGNGQLGSPGTNGSKRTPTQIIQ
ncbi:MAG TPA: Ig-like domain-containing protein [Gemmatimonadaceae bacterium]|nr:Ig-like domain-containing protein [Gemmatimonadaceae bacterium]